MTYYSPMPDAVAPAQGLGVRVLWAHQQDELARRGDVHASYLTRHGAPPHVAPDHGEGLGLAVHEHGERCHRLRMEQQG